MNQIMAAKIEACLEVCFGTTPEKRAETFKRFVFKATGLTEQGFNELGLTQVTYDLLKGGEHSTKEILDIVF